MKKDTKTSSKVNKVDISDLNKEEVKEIKTNNSSKRNKLYISFKTKIIIYGLLLFIFLILGTLFITKSFSFKAGDFINYEEKSNVDYKVYLKENDFYENNYLGKDMAYVASLIDYIDTSFTYNFNIDNKSNVNFTYDAIGVLTIADTTGENIFFEKEYNLLDSTKETISNDTTYSVSKNIRIDYNYYNALANQFKTSYGIDTTSTLTVYFRVKEEGDNGNYNLNNNSNMSLVIPLSQRAVNIKLDYTEVNQNNKVLNDDLVLVNNYLYIAIGIILIIVSIIFTIKLVRLLKYITPRKNVYDKYVNKILKEYDRLIIETSTAPRIEESKVINVSKFEELLDARDNLKLPIKYYVVTKHQKGYFYITHNDELYLLKVKKIDLEEDKNEK